MLYRKLLERFDLRADRTRLAGIAGAVAGSGLLWLLLWGGFSDLVLSRSMSPGARTVIAIAGLLALPTWVAFVLVRRLLEGFDEQREELRRERDRYRTFFAEADVVFFSCDWSGRFDFVNRAGIELFSTDPVAKGLSLIDVVSPASTAALEELLTDPEVSGNDRRTVQVECVGWGDTVFPVELTVRIIRDGAGSVTAYRGSARPLDEADPQRSDHGDRVGQFKTLIDNLPEGVILVDGGGRIQLTNQPAHDYLEEYGTYVADQHLVLFAGVPVESLFNRSGDAYGQEIVVREPYHQVLEIYGQRFEEGGGGLLVVRDVTVERQRSERLQRRERLAAVGQLAAGVAHDFKNILQGIALCAELSRSPEASENELQNSMTTIVEQSQRGSKLIQQIMDFTRQSESTQRLLDLRELLEQTQEFLSPGIPKTIDFRLEVGEGNDQIMADPAQIQQVIANLVLNASDAMPDGGRLTVALNRVGDESEEVGLPPEVRGDDWIRITVSDTGTGIPKSAQARIFEPFFTTKPAGGGTGLGLAQAYGHVHQHGGHIEFETEGGQGTVFSVFLPAYRHHVRSEVGTAEPEECPRGNGETVLVVEDEPAVRHATSQSLEALGYRVLEAANGEQALDVFGSDRAIDLVLTDARMPGIDGLTLTSRIKSLDPEVKVLVMSAYVSEYADNSVPPANADGLLAKPFSMHKLGTTVHHTLVSLSQGAR